MVKKSVPIGVSKLLAGITGFCSVIYMLVFSESLFMLYESTRVYSFVLGFFLFGVVVGASFIKKIILRFRNIFLLTEFSLPVVSVLGFLGVVCLYVSSFSFFVSLLLSGVFVFLVGFLSGFEAELFVKHNSKVSLGCVVVSQVVGCVLGAFLFSFVLFPFFGIMASLILVGFLNIVVASIYVILRDVLNGKFKLDWGEFFTFLFLVLFLWGAFEVDSFASSVEDLVFDVSLGEANVVIEQSSRVSLE